METTDTAKPWQRALVAGLAQHEGGDFAGAAACYRRVLEAVPEHPYALNLLGLIEYQCGRYPTARALAQRAIAGYPTEARFHLNLANISRAESRLTEAEASYRAAISHDPSLGDSYVGLGNLLRERGRLDEGVTTLRSGVVAAPDRRFELVLNLGVVLTEAGRHGEAVGALREAVKLREDDAEARYNLGNALFAAGSFAEAATALAEAVRLRPAFAQAWYNLGNARSAEGRLHDAATAYRSAVGLDPRMARAWINLGNVESSLNHAAEASSAYACALELDPQNSRAICGRGRALLELEDPAAAARDFERAIAADPACAPAYLGLGLVLQKAGQMVDSVVCLDRAIAFDPDLVEAHEIKGGSLWNLGRMREAISAYDRAADLAPLSLRAASSSAFGRTYLADCTPEEVLEAHRAYARRLPRPPVPAAVRRTPERLRIGYVSADFRRHSVAYFVEPVLAHHDRGAFEIRCYYNHRKADDVTARLLALSDGWVDCADLSDDELEARIRADRIDILVDLSGHTSGNRLTVFARRPAPVQGIWLGYPTTTGLDAIDFRVSDWCVDPEGEERASVERVARLEDSYFCFGAPRIAARLGPPPMSRTGEPVFGSFNNLAKASGDALALWKRVLDSVSGSRLMLKSKGLADEKSRADFCERLEGAGISRERVILSGWKESTGAHLAAYDEVDIGLDTTPYNGATTTCEALWMGVPVVTLRGRTHASRMGASILAAAGLDELVARTGDDYVRIAVELAKEPQRVSSLRVGLRERLTASRLMDAPRFVAGLERAFRQVWQESGQ